MSLRETLQDALRQLDELERDARKYRSGEVKINVRDLDLNLYSGDNSLMGLIKGPTPVRLVVDFYCKSFEEKLSMYNPVERSFSGLMDFVRVLEEEPHA